MIKENKYNSNLVRKLQKVLKQEDTILFVGSGISSWSGLPSWYKLISELANYLEREGYSNADAVRKKINDDLLLAASIGLKSLNKMYFKEFLKGICGSSVAKPHDIHKKIVSLGPTCYITTNYDQLLEDTLRENRKGIHWDVVTNRQLAELASLNQARYKDYVFKVHGDVNDIESVVLSREHYQKLYGERNSALNTLEILLTTKPVVFLGFGLRDPDFLQVRDKMKNIYGDNRIEHYAIMPDVSEEEISYWQTEYGIRILSYQTTRNADRSSNHSELLEVLDILKFENKSDEDNTVQQIVSSDNEKYNLTDSQVLSLLRFIDGQKLHIGIDDAEVYPMSFSKDNYKLCDIDSIMKSSDNALILGEPGGGKTYCLKHYSINQMEKFKELIIRDLKRIKEATLPIYIDLKGYTGNVYEMIESLLPVDINLNMLKENLNMIFLFDSFNEMPKEIFEERLYEKDFLDFKEDFKESKIVISSRTEEGLGKINLSKYMLRDIDYDYIKNYLDKNLIDSNTVFDREIMYLLQKPLYFKLLNAGKIIIDNSSTPHTIYKSFFNYLNQELKKKLNIEINLSEILSSIGYYAINKGSEKIGMDVIKGIIYSELEKRNISSVNENHILNELIEMDILITSAGLKLSFFHQSITEYLAAKKLAAYFNESPDILINILNNTRWDQAVFLTIGFLEKEKINIFFNEIFKKDLCFAIKACKYIGYGHSEIVSRILKYLVEFKTMINFDHYSDVCESLKDLQVGIEHEYLLRELIPFGSLLGANAVILLDKIIDGNVKEEIREELLSVFLLQADNFNFGYQVGGILGKYLNLTEVKKMVDDLKEFKDEGEVVGLVQGLEKILIKFDLESIESIFSPIVDLNDIQLNLYFRVLGKNNKEFAFQTFINVIKKGRRAAIFPLYLLILGDKFQYDKKLLFQNDLIENILSFLRGPGAEWTLSLIVKMAKHNEIKNYFRYKYIFLTDIEKLGVLYSIFDEVEEDFWSQLTKVVRDRAKGEQIDLKLIGGMTELDWSGKELLFQEIITLIPITDMHYFIESFNSRYEEKISINISLESILLMLEKIHEEEMDFEFEHYMYSIVGDFIVNNCDSLRQKELINLFNKKECPYRDFLAEHVINRLSNITTDSLTKHAIDYLLAKLESEDITYYDSLIGNIVTENFINERLFPLLESDNDLLKSNIKQLLYVAGKYHKKRFISY